ncbi:MAG: IS91 family transposase [Polyangiaceae bacterium]
MGTRQRPSLEVADIVRAHGEAFARAHALTPQQRAVLRDIVRCRTAELGGHKDVCASCGHVQSLSYNSCRNRHCPKCQSIAQARWVEQRMARMLPTHAFHVVFTLPKQLRRLALANRDLVFDLLFSCAAASLQAFARDPRRLGAELGITTVLHTWTRDLRFHPHVHCIVTGGGLSVDGLRWVPAPSHYLFPVRALGALFRGKLLDALRGAHRDGRLRFDGPAASFADAEAFRRLLDRLHRIRWVVYCKPPFGDQDQVFRYLGQYTYRVGISNHRLVAMDSRTVTFRTRGDAKVTLDADEFLRRFVLHVLPKGFVKVRHHGLFAAGNVGSRLSLARALLAQASSAASAGPPCAQPPDAPLRDYRDILCALTGLDLRACARCGAFDLVRCALDSAANSLHTSDHPPSDTS